MKTSTNTVGGVNVSHETLERLEYLCVLISKWTKSINLIAPKSVPDLWDRHIIDSAQIFQHAPEGWTNWTDLGSGGGLPGLVVAILDTHNRPVTLVESDQRKCLFLSTAKREMSLNVEIVNLRIEMINPRKTSVLSARALAPLNDLLKHAESLLQTDGVALFPKGARFQEEVDEATRGWEFDMKAHQSQTNPDSRVLEISRIHRRES